MKVHCDEGVATHIGPESCAGADAVLDAEGNTDGCAIRERPDGPAWSETLACADALCTGTGRSHVRPFGMHRRSAWGRRGAVAHDART